MKDSVYCSQDSSRCEMCSSPDFTRSILSLKYSELPTSEYNCFLYGLQDERDFEEFKRDLKDLQKLKSECCGNVNGLGDNDGQIDLNELHFICRPNYVCKNRRGRASRCVKEFKQTLSRSTEKFPPIRANSSDESTYLRGKPSFSSDQTQKSGRSRRPDSFGRRSGVDRKSSLLCCERNCGRGACIGDILVEFLDRDEHFQEFERVFETVKSRRVSRDFDTSRRLSSNRTSRSSIKGNESCERTSRDVQELSSSVVSDIFADFFDNDETFLEFEKEFDNFRSNRRSNFLGSLSNPDSNYDLNDLKVDCDMNMNSISGSSLNTFPCLAQDNTHSCSTEDNNSPCSTQEYAYPCSTQVNTSTCFSQDLISGDGIRNLSLVLSSVEDWRKMFRKVKSCLPLDVHQSGCLDQHGHPVHILSEHEDQAGSQSQTSILADIDGLPPREITNEHGTEFDQTVSGLIQTSSSPNFQEKRIFNSDFNWSNSSPNQINNNVDDSSAKKWSDILDTDDLDSPISNHCSSPSCFCYTDLHIEEPCDVLERHSAHQTTSSSQTLMDREMHPRHEDLGICTSSLKNVCFSKGYIESDTLLMDVQGPGKSHRKVDDKNFSVFDLNDDSLTDCSQNRPSSTASSELSDADSECYHSATSDLSGRYSTAKSELSVLTGRPASANLDLSEKSNPAVCIPGNVFHLTRLQLNRPIIRGEYHSYGGGDRRTKCKLDRPLSGSACQYTCHQHCLPAVTLSCKSISGDGYDAISSRTPSPSNPRPLLETLSGIRARPGSAVIVPGSTNTPRDSTAVGGPQVSESVLDFQQISPKTNRQVGIHPEGYTISPKISTTQHLRSWSISEDLATAHIPPSGNAPGGAPESSQVQLISSPQCLSSHSHSPAGSPHLRDTSRQPYSTSHTDYGGSTSLIHHVGNLDESVKDNVTGFLQVGTVDEDTNPDAATEKDETDSGYRSGTIPDDKLPRVPSQTTLDQQELKRRVAKYNHFVPAVSLQVTGEESFQGFLKVTMNLIRPITMELGARPPSIYELLTREHIIEENTQHVAFYMPRDTHKSLHITSDTTTKEVIASLLKKFHILDHPRKFAMYEQEFSDRNKLVRLRRLTDKDFPLRAMVSWDPERIRNYRMVLQENETGEIVWDAFSLPELNNFLKVLDREEKETVIDLKHKYAYMKQYMERRLVELRTDCGKKTKNKV